MIVNIIRHASTKLTEEGCLCGITDVSISEKGIKEIKNLVSQEIYGPVDHCYVSTLKRTKETKDIIYPDTPFTVFPGLNEFSFGAYECIPSASFMKYDNPISRFLKHVDEDEVPPKGESFNHLKQRVKESFPKLLDDAFNNGYNEISIIGHGVYFSHFLLIYFNDNRPDLDRIFEVGRGIRIEVNKENDEYTYKMLGKI